ncbi:alpha/beta hydrolase [Salarchaeum sp. III]|uniref:alpha/beta hydrolase n=1 Tax=Salarchaeum sp. III TaxID=3107927 RepID=UPI002EDAD25B
MTTDATETTDEMHPQARAVVERQRKLGLTPLHRHGVRRLRFLMRVSAWLSNRNPPAVGATFDRTIPGYDDGDDVPVRVYRPEGRGPFPTVVFYHGGGYVMGSLATHDRLCRELARRSDSVVVAVDYRLAPEHPFPAAIEDASAALSWAAANPDALASTGTVSVVGDSAGGTLAAVVALIAAERDGPTVAHQALCYPGIGVELEQESVQDHAGTVLSRADLEWFRDCYYGSDIVQRNPYADPIHADDLSGVPPATVITAGFDPLRDGGRAYAERLVADGVDVSYEEYEDMIHGFMTNLHRPRIDRAYDAVDRVAAALPE